MRRSDPSPPRPLVHAVPHVALSTLKQFWEAHPEHLDVQQPALAWYQHAKRADWATPADVKADFRNASILKGGRVVFNLAGEKYRLVVWINDGYKVVYIRFIGTHKQYDQIDVRTIWGGTDADDGGTEHARRRPPGRGGDARGSPRARALPHGAAGRGGGDQVRD